METPCGPAPAPGTQTAVALRIPAGGEATLKVVDGELWFGATPERCAGFTTSNVTQIEINRFAGASTTPGTTERLILDLSTGALGPGAPNETSQLSEIEVLVNLGDATDEVVVIGGDGDDTFTAGIKGVSLNTDNDVDVEFAQAVSASSCRATAAPTCCRLSADSARARRTSRP